MIKNLFKNKWLIRSIGIIIFVLILVFKIDFNKIHQLVKFDFSYLFSALIIIVLSSIIRPLRWQYILKKINIAYSFKKVFQLYYIGVLFGNITPGKLGEFGRTAYLKKDNHPINESLISILIDKAADAILLLIIGFLGIIYLRRILSINIVVTSIIIISGIIFLTIIIKTRLYRVLIPKNWQIYILNLFKGLKFYKTKNYLFILFLTFIHWFFHYLILYLLALSVGITNLSLFYFAISIAIAELITLLPISILGIGTRDISLLFLFSLFNIPAETTISFSVLSLIIVIGTNSLIGLISMLTHKSDKVSDFI